MVVDVLSLGVSGGPSVAESGTFSADAYEHLHEVVIPKNSVPTTLKVQPALLVDLKALAIVCDNYDGDVAFTVDLVALPITMNAPIVMIGAGALSLFGPTVNDLIFTNTAEAAAKVTVLAIRDAIPEGA